MNSFLKIIGSLLLSVAFVAFIFFTLGPEWHGQNQEKRWMLGWANSGVARHLDLGYTPEFVDAAVDQQLNSKRWTVTGSLVLKNEDGSTYQKPYRATIEQLCGAVVERRCWRLVAAEVEGKALSVTASSPATGSADAVAQQASARSNLSESVGALGVEGKQIGGQQSPQQDWASVSAALQGEGKYQDEQSFASESEAGGKILVRAAFEVRRRGELEQAIDLFTQALDSGGLTKEERATVLYNRGGAHLARGAFRRAINDFTGAIELAPNLDAAFFDRGRAYERSGQRSLAWQDFRKAVELNPSIAAYQDKLEQIVAR